MKRLFTQETYVVGNIPFVSRQQNNPMRQFVAEFFRNGKVQFNAIKSHRAYQYSYLREETQDYILSKLQMLIDSKIIRGTFENGMEYTIVATVLNMNRDLTRMIQKFDFTKVNPKIVYINTTEKVISPEDSILMAFLNLVGFDIDLATAVGEELGMTVEFKPIDWNAKEMELKAKTIDCVWNGMSVTPDRLENMALSNKYLSVTVNLTVTVLYS